LTPESIAGIAVAKILAIDGKKFVLADASWVLIRPSGTEPLFRIYVETDQKEKIVKIQQAVREMLNL